MGGKKRSALMTRLSLSLSLSLLLIISILYPSAASAVPLGPHNVSDNFDDGNFLGWTPIDQDGSPASWSVVGGELDGRGDANGAAVDSLIQNDTIFGPDLAVDVDLQFFSAQIDLLLRISPSDPDDYVVLKFFPADVPGVCRNVVADPLPCVRIREVIDGTEFSPLGGASGAFIAGLGVGDDTHLRVTLVDLDLTIEWAGAEVFNETLPLSAANIGEGRLGFRVADGTDLATSGHWRIDNFQLDGTIIPEPSTGLLVASGLIVLARRRLLPHRRS
jgi:hypothetical protein